jgi:hypothetical protein
MASTCWCASPQHGIGSLSERSWGLSPRQGINPASSCLRVAVSPCPPAPRPQTTGPCPDSFWCNPSIWVTLTGGATSSYLFVSEPAPQQAKSRCSQTQNPKPVVEGDRDSFGIEADDCSVDLYAALSTCELRDSLALHRQFQLNLTARRAPGCSDQESSVSGYVPGPCLEHLLPPGRDHPHPRWEGQPKPLIRAPLHHPSPVR